MQTGNVSRNGFDFFVGHFLGDAQINIESFTLSRNRQGGKAMAVIRADGDLRPSHLEELKKIEHVVNVKMVVL